MGSMGIACKMGGHKWNGCTCSRCGEHRYEGHDYQLVVLDVSKRTVFGNSRRKQCAMVCSICGSTRSAEHDWDGCSCTRCDEKRNQDHAWGVPEPLSEGDKRRKSHHREKCTKCGEIRFLSHSFERIAGGLQRCRECGLEIESLPKFRTPEAESDFYAKLIASGEAGYYDIESRDGQRIVKYGDHVTTMPALTRLFIALADNAGADNAAPKGIARKLNEIASEHPEQADAVGAAFAQIALDESVDIYWRSWVAEHDWIKDEGLAAEARASVKRWHEEHPRSQADIDYENAMIAADSGIGRSG